MSNWFGKNWFRKNTDNIVEKIAEKIVKKIMSNDYINFVTNDGLITAINDFEKAYKNNTKQKISKASKIIIQFIYKEIEKRTKNKPDDELLGNIILKIKAKIEAKIKAKLDSTAGAKYRQYVDGGKQTFDII